MRALVATAYGDVDKLQVREMPEPRVAPGEVKVKVQAAGLNPIDWKMLSGARRSVMPLEFPAILGRDAAGEVVEVGEGVRGLRRGDRVLGLTWHAFAELAVGPEKIWAKLPPGLDVKQAGALPLVLTTGAQLADKVPLEKGSVILVTGALGGVGRTAFFVAKRAGATVLAGVKRSQVERARKLSAGGVVAIDDDEEIAQLPQLDAICDTVNGETIEKLLPRLKKGGVLGSVLGVPEKAKELGVNVQAFMSQPDGPRLGELASAVAQGQLEIPVSQTFALGDGARAMKFARDEADGKVVIVPYER
jgi:NADPH:quinone reductase-like Zn-dependent oxidoreductase